MIEKYAKIGIVAALLVLIVIFFPRLSTLTPEDILSYTPDSLLLAALVFWGIYALKSLMMVLPLIVLWISAGMLFPPVWAILITYLGVIIEITIGYWFGRHMGGEKIQERIEKNEKISSLLNFREGKGYLTCFVFRIVPVPFDLATMFFGASGMPYFPFVFFSLLGLSPSLISYVIAGGAINNPLSLQFLIPMGCSIAISIAAFFLYQKLRKEKREPKGPR